MQLKQSKKPQRSSRRLATAKGGSRELYFRPELTGWTPDRVQRASDMADAGNMLSISDLVETISRDDRVRGVLSTRTHGLLGLPVDFMRGDKEAREALSAKSDGAPGEWQSMHAESELAKLLRWGLVLGVGLAQRIPQPRLIGEPHRYKLRTWSPRWLTYHHTPVDGVHWWLQTLEGMKPVIPGDGEWILYTPYGETRPWAEGLWTALAFPWLLKRFSLEDRANYSDVLGSPVWVGMTSEGSTEKQRTRYLSQLRTLGKNGKIVLPKGWDLQLKEATGKSWEVYQNQVEWGDQAMTITLAGQIVTTEGTSGFSAGNIFDAIKWDLIRFDAETIASCLRSQSLELWALWNYGSRTAAPWPEWRTQQPTDQSEEADGLSKLGDAITKLDAALSKHGLEVDAAKLVADFDIPVREITAPKNALRRGKTK